MEIKVFLCQLNFGGSAFARSRFKVKRQIIVVVI